MVIPSGGGGVAMVGVTPNAKLKKQAEQFKIAMLAEAIIFTLLLLSGNFGAFIQLLSVALGWYSIWDPAAFQPTIMQIFFSLTVFGAVFAGVLLALSISAFVETKVYWGFVDIGLWTVAFGILILVAYLSWNMYKEMIHAPSASSIPLNAPFSRDDDGAYSAPSATFNVLGTGGSSTAASTQGFAAFQGEGRKLRS